MIIVLWIWIALVVFAILAALDIRYHRKWNCTFLPSRGQFNCEGFKLQHWILLPFTVLLFLVIYPITIIMLWFSNGQK